MMNWTKTNSPRNWVMEPLTVFLSKSSIWVCRPAVGCVFSDFFSFQTTFPKRHLTVFCKLPRHLTSSGGLDMCGVANSRVHIQFLGWNGSIHWDHWQKALHMFVDCRGTSSSFNPFEILPQGQGETFLFELFIFGTKKKNAVEIYFIWLWQAEHLAIVQAQGPESSC